MALPSGAVPWGRWIEQNADANSEGVDRQRLDGGSAGSLFAARADLLQGQIAATPSISAIYERVIPPFSVSRSLNPSAVRYVYNSAPITFNPPRFDRPYSYSVIANMQATGNLLTFSQSLLRTNGIDNSFQHENLRPGDENSGIFSILGSGSISEGSVVTTQFAIAGPASGTLNFGSCTVWCIFSGSIL